MDFTTKAFYREKNMGNYFYILYDPCCETTIYPKIKRFQSTHNARMVDENNRTEMAKLTCLLRERSKITFISDWKLLMDILWGKR